MDRGVEHSEDGGGRSLCFPDDCGSAAYEPTCAPIPLAPSIPHRVSQEREPGQQHLLRRVHGEGDRHRQQCMGVASFELRWKQQIRLRSETGMTRYTFQR